MSYNYLVRCVRRYIIYSVKCATLLLYLGPNNECALKEGRLSGALGVSKGEGGGGGGGGGGAGG